MDVAFLFCVEPGSLEPKARLLVESIRRWGGRMGQAPIFAYQPRGTDALAPETHRLFERLQVEHRAGSFNRDDTENAYANKVHACAHLARSSSCGVIAFLDTDTVLLNEPTALMIEAGTELAVTPVVKKYAGTSGRRRDVNDPLWRRLYAAAGVEPPPFVRTVYDGARIRAYFNGGLVAFRPEFADAWLRMLRLAMPLLPTRRQNNLDQISLALAAATRPERVRVLPPAYNYPINRRAWLPGPEIGISQLVHVHYHNAFNAAGFLTEIRPALDTGDPRFEWLQSRLPLGPVFPIAQLKGYRGAPAKEAIKMWWNRARLEAENFVTRATGRALPLTMAPLPHRH